MKIQTKICGITRLEDALLAVRYGVDALGFVFYENSKRYITPDQAKQIILKTSPFTQAVGLFVNETADNIRHVLSNIPLNILQFHGDESPEFCRQFHRPYLKAIRVQSSVDIVNAMAQYDDARAVLFDAHIDGAYGGTGQRFDWELLPKNLEGHWILSGGLNANNIRMALEMTGAIAVDVSSGVESSSGVKSPEKMQQFLDVCQNFQVA